MVQEYAEMIRVAFALPEDERWTGGVNYLHNLLFAMASVEKSDLEPLLFAGNQVDDSILRRFVGLARIERNPLFNRLSPACKIRRTISRLTGEDWLVRNLFMRHGIDVASHCNLSGRFLPFSTINWIPDFQHLHLPELFPSAELARRDRKYRQWIGRSDRMVLSSQDALADYRKFAPGHDHIVRVLHFVSQVKPLIYGIDDIRPIREKLGLPEKFFYLPNQFWKHKNHLVVVKAIGLLKQRGIEVHVVCSGFAADLKNSDYFDELRGLIDEQGLSRQVHILGLIDYDEVLALFRHAVSVVNPSFFEGWSSTVEEAKSVGKNMILSDIAVHREQNPPEAAFFDPHSAEQLASILEARWRARGAGPDFELERRARAELPARTRSFGEAFEQVVVEVRG